MDLEEEASDSLCGALRRGLEKNQTDRKASELGFVWEAVEESSSPVGKMATQSRLPPDWYEYLDPRGVPYYHNRVLNITQWERPSSASSSSLPGAGFLDGHRGQEDTKASSLSSYKEQSSSAGLNGETGRSGGAQKSGGVVSLGEGGGTLSFLSAAASTSPGTVLVENKANPSSSTSRDLSQPYEGLSTVTLDLSKDGGRVASIVGAGQKRAGSTRGGEVGLGSSSYSRRSDLSADSVRSSGNSDGDQRRIVNPFISKDLSGVMEGRGKGWRGGSSSSGQGGDAEGAARPSGSNLLLKFFPVCHSCFRDTYGVVEKLFDFTTEEILLRLKLVLLPWKSPADVSWGQGAAHSPGGFGGGGGLRGRGAVGEESQEEEGCLSYRASGGPSAREKASCFLENPDLYGPFWTATTLVVLFFACSNLPFLLFPSSFSLQGKEGGGMLLTSQGPDLRRLSQIAFSVYGCTLLPPLFCWLGILWYTHHASSNTSGDEEEAGSSVASGLEVGATSSSPKLEQLLCLQGYALVPFCAAGLVLLFLQGFQPGGGGAYSAVSVLRWGISGMSAASAAFFLYVHLKTLLEGQEKRVKLVSSAVLIGAVLLLLVVLLNAVSVGQKIPGIEPATKASATEGGGEDTVDNRYIQQSVVGGTGGEEEGKKTTGDEESVAAEPKTLLTDTGREEQREPESRSDGEETRASGGGAGISEKSGQGNGKREESEAGAVHMERSSSGRRTAPGHTDKEGREHGKHTTAEKTTEGQPMREKNPTEDIQKSGGGSVRPLKSAGEVEQEDNEGKEDGGEEGGVAKDGEGEGGREGQVGQNSADEEASSAGQKAAEGEGGGSR